MKRKQILIRVTDREKEGIKKESKKESKSISKYLLDNHIEHCETKYNDTTICSLCGAKNKKIKVKCWQCKK